MARQETVSTDQLKGMLLERITALVARYAPAVQGSYTDKGLYFTLNPGRHDRSVGSFVVNMDGPRKGRWHDYATGQGGDLIDLIALYCGCSPREAFAEARAFLGLSTMSPEARRRLDEAAARQAEQIKRDAARKAEHRTKVQKWAEGLWLSAQEQIAGTPVESYLSARGLDLAALGRQPRALRFHPECLLSEEHVDPETGEILTHKVRMPAMVASIVDGRGKIIACHRTYLAQGRDGIWRKAPVKSPKKVLGDYAGGSIRLSSGIGPRGGKAAGLAQAPAGTRVHIAEGVETGLSAMVLRPGIRVVAAVSLSNMGGLWLPSTVSEVVLISDNDDHPQARAAFQKAIDAHAAAGRRVFVWRAGAAGRDLNDELQAALKNAAGRTEGAA